MMRPGMVMAACGAVALGQAVRQPGEFPTEKVLILVGALIVAALIAGLIIMAVRTRLLAKGKVEAGHSMLEDLRNARQRGEISEDEFEATRSAILGKISGRPVPVRGAPGANAVDALRAPPGFDLTGQPLPSPRGPGSGGTSGGKRSGARDGGGTPPSQTGA